MNSRYFTTLVLLAALLLFGSTGCKSTQPTAQFATPDEAAQKFVSAVRTNNQAELKRLLGADAVDALDSGDEVADQQMRQKFVARYDEKNFLVRSSDDQIAVLSVGANEWPMPIPIVKDGKSGKWYFDTPAGVEEIVNRRIGQNELDVMEVCLAIVDAQRDYTMLDPDQDGVPQYARKIISDPGKRNGLYWETSPSEPSSPLGPLVAGAVEEGYGKNRTANSEPRPYHGYFYHLLTSQGPHAPGGAMDYEVKGFMIAGFGVVAYPADYGDSGIMSFIVNQDGVVYQKDLGDDTARTAEAMTSFDPGPGWTRVDSTTPARSNAAKEAK